MVFDDLGAYYASVLHPLVTPLQASLIIGAAALIAQQSRIGAAIALPLFIVTSLVGYAALWGAIVQADPFWLGLSALLVGLIAMAPMGRVAASLGWIGAGVAGFCTGLMPDRPAREDLLLSGAGTSVGIASLLIASWLTLDVLGRRASPLVPKVVGAWVAAVGILVCALSFSAGDG